MKSFKYACREAARRSEMFGTTHYVTDAPICYQISPERTNDWLFKVYPGGRKILSVKGKEFVEKLGKNGTNLED